MNMAIKASTDPIAQLWRPASIVTAAAITFANEPIVRLELHAANLGAPITTTTTHLGAPPTQFHPLLATSNEATL